MIGHSTVPERRMPASRTLLRSHALAVLGLALLGGSQQAELGTAGVSPTGDAAVYFELRIDGRPVDPVEWLR